MPSEQHVSQLRAPDDASSTVRYVARQPILTADERVFGYELLYRSSFENQFSSTDPDDATRSVVNMSALLGLEILCDGGRGFINCTAETLRSGCLSLLPPNEVVIEILETVTPADSVRQMCNELRSGGYKIALDDFTINDPRECMIDIADFVKVDLKQTSWEDIAGIAKRIGSGKCALLAEKVETREEFERAKELGFGFFQGYFFRKPKVMKTRIEQSKTYSRLRLLQVVTKPELQWGEVEDVLSRDAMLSYRLLRYLNSAAFGLRGTIHSLRQALTFLGENEFRRWCSLSLMLEMGQKKPSDLLLSSLTRARLSELIGLRMGLEDTAFFLLGLFSLMDALLEIPMPLVVDSLPVDQPIKSALLQESGKLTSVLKLVMAAECGDWNSVSAQSAALGLTDSFVAESQWSAMGWTHEFLSAGKVA